MRASAAGNIRAVQLPAGESIPVLGQGTWRMGERRRSRKEEIGALQLGLDLGLSVIDTAELYGAGATEELVGEAIARRREDVFLVDKVLPNNASRRGTVRACEKSLRRLQTDYIDLYLLHWPGDFPLEETVSGFQELIDADKIRYWGVSNLDMAELEELMQIPGGDAVQTNQVLYNLTRRGIEYDMLPWCQSRGLPIMAYSPIQEGRLHDDARLRSIAARHDATTAQVALAWVLRNSGVMAIPKAGTAEHVRENRAALELQLTPDDLIELDGVFPPPNGPVPLETA